MDDAAFTQIDGMIFKRLHWGSLAPMTFHLKDGRKVTGQVLAISRNGAFGAVNAVPGGEVWVSEAGSKSILSYDMILDIE